MDGMLSGESGLIEIYLKLTRLYGFSCSFRQMIIPLNWWWIVHAELALRLLCRFHSRIRSCSHVIGQPSLVLADAVVKYIQVWIIIKLNVGVEITSQSLWNSTMRRILKLLKPADSIRINSSNKSNRDSRVETSEAQYKEWDKKLYL